MLPFSVQLILEVSTNMLLVHVHLDIQHHFERLLAYLIEEPALHASLVLEFGLPMLLTGGVLLANERFVEPLLIHQLLVVLYLLVLFYCVLDFIEYI